MCFLLAMKATFINTGICIIIQNFNYAKIFPNLKPLEAKLNNFGYR